MAAILNAYNYFMASYSSSYNKVNRYDTHKKSELRNIYNTIVKLNTESPLYMFKMSNDLSSFAVEIKESARNLKNVISSLSDDSSYDDFSKKVAESSNPEIVDVSYIGNYSETNSLESFEMEVSKLATPQVNLGNFLSGNKTTTLEPGDYNFNVDINNLNYEFQFSVNANDTNKNLQDKITRLINKTKIGIAAEVYTNDSDSFSLKITSAATGHPENGKYIFNIYEDEGNNIVDYLGINSIAKEASNSSFTLNGISKSSYANTFTINKCFEVTLKSESKKDAPVKIGFKTDLDSMMENIANLVGAYNNILVTADGYSSSSYCSPKLLKDIGNIAIDFKNELDSIGLTVADSGNINIDKPLLLETALNTEDSALVNSVLKDFKRTIDKRASFVLLNPMEYANKTLVAYKNPVKTNYSTPYITSIYSGMMFNSYC